LFLNERYIFNSLLPMVHWRSNRAAAGKIYYLIEIKTENPAPAHIGVTFFWPHR
jgi:hypothetical protein